MNNLAPHGVRVVALVLAVAALAPATFTQPDPTFRHAVKQPVVHGVAQQPVTVPSGPRGEEPFRLQVEKMLVLPAPTEPGRAPREHAVLLVEFENLGKDYIHRVDSRSVLKSESGREWHTQPEYAYIPTSDEQKRFEQQHDVSMGLWSVPPGDVVRAGLKFEVPAGTVARGGLSFSSTWFGFDIDLASINPPATGARGG